MEHLNKISEYFGLNPDVIDKILSNTPSFIGDSTALNVFLKDDIYEKQDLDIFLLENKPKNILNDVSYIGNLLKENGFNREKNVLTKYGYCGKNQRGNNEGLIRVHIS